MLVNLKQIIGMAEEGGYCIPAFNVYNIETVKAMALEKIELVGAAGKANI